MQPMLHAVVFIVAEKQGFEPWRPVTSLRAFQARPFDRLGIPPFADLRHGVL